MSWNDYHLNDPFFCTPLPVMRGLVSALCERREAVDSVFHASCTSSGVSAVTENCLNGILFCGTASEIPFRKIRKESSGSLLPEGSSLRYSFMHRFDALLLETLEGFSQTGGYAHRAFADSTGIIAYNTLESLASALSEPLAAPYSIPASSAVEVDGDFQVRLNAAWAAQRTKMLKLLRHVRLSNGGFTMQYAIAADHGYGSSPQNAFDAISSWTVSSQAFAGWETPLECRVEYHYNAWDAPEERWAIDSAWKVLEMAPVFDGCLETSAGSLRFNAEDLRERDGEGNPEQAENTIYPFDPLGTPVSSGANVLPLSSGVFASWGSCSADIGSSGDGVQSIIMGWQALNVRVVYDYEPAFNFKQEE